jgi:hypothetical protein
MTLSDMRAPPGQAHGTVAAPSSRKSYHPRFHRSRECANYFANAGYATVDFQCPGKNRLDTAMGNPTALRLHDLRRTFVTGLADLGIRPDVIELAVNHRSGLRGGIAGVYNKSELLPERRAALERWAAHVAGLVAAKPRR